jgi:hypothetical protein
MMHTPTNTAVRKGPALGELRDGACPISDDEVSLALHAAGASAEDVARYFALETTRSPGKVPGSQHKTCSGTRCG